MKKYVTEFFRRGAMACGIGSIILVIVYLILQYQGMIETLTVDAIEYSMQSGKIDIKHGNLSEAAQLLVDSFFCGCQLVANSYPANVKVTKH